MRKLKITSHPPTFITQHPPHLPHPNITLYLPHSVHQPHPYSFIFLPTSRTQISALKPPTPHSLLHNLPHLPYPNISLKAPHPPFITPQPCPIQEAASYGAKVAVLDFVKSSPQGTTWGLYLVYFTSILMI